MFSMYVVTCKGKLGTQKKIIYARNAREAIEEAEKRLKEYCRCCEMKVINIEFIKTLD